MRQFYQNSLEIITLIISAILAILGRKFIQFDKLEFNLFTESIHLKGTYIQGSGYIKIPFSDFVLSRKCCKV